MKEKPMLPAHAITADAALRADMRARWSCDPEYSCAQCGLPARKQPDRDKLWGCPECGFATRYPAEEGAFEKKQAA